MRLSTGVSLEFGVGKVRNEKARKRRPMAFCLHQPLTTRLGTFHRGSRPDVVRRFVLDVFWPCAVVCRGSQTLLQAALSPPPPLHHLTSSTSHALLLTTTLPFPPPTTRTGTLGPRWCVWLLAWTHPCPWWSPKPSKPPPTHHHPPTAFFDARHGTFPLSLQPPLVPYHVGLREDEHGGAGTLQFLRGEATKPSPERSGQAKGTSHHGARAILASPTTSTANQHRPCLVRGAALAATGGRRTDAASGFGRWWWWRGGEW